MSTDKKIKDNELYTAEVDDKEDPYAKELHLEPTTVDVHEKHDEPRPKTFHSKHVVPEEIIAEPKVQSRISHAEASGVIISGVMLIYSLTELDKPLFFLSTALLTFLLRPIIGGLFGKHNRAVQNALHSFSVVLFIGSLIMLFL